MKTFVLLMMGGIGSRFGADMPKQFTIIEEKPLFIYIASKLAKQKYLNGIVIVVKDTYLEYTREWVNKLHISKILKIVPGGKTRSDSVFNGLKALIEYADDNDVVLMHDATHPYVDDKGMETVVRETIKYGSATLASLNYDTTYLMDEDNNIVKVIPRKQVVVGASPEGFRYRDIFEIYANTSTEDMENMTSVGAIALKHNIPMKVVPTSILNLKITYPEDMNLFQKLYKLYFFENE